MERRAIAAHRRELVSALRRLGEEQTPVLGAEFIVGRTRTVLNLTLPQHRLALAGAASGACAALCPNGDRVVPATMVSDAGRYGRAWWLTLTVGGGAVTVLGSHIHLVPHTYGRSVPDAGPGPEAASSVLTGARGG